MPLFDKKKKPIGNDDINSRQAVLWMHPSAILPFMTSQRWVITEGALPFDIQFHHVFFDNQKQIFGVVCISKSFDRLYVGQALPELPQVSFRFYDPVKDGIIE